MTVVLPFHAGDANAARELLKWIRDLGKSTGHRLVLVVDYALCWTDVQDEIHLGAETFDGVNCITNGQSVTGWPAGANSLFYAAARYLEGHPFLWLEPDCVPLCRDWLDKILSDYATCGKPFLGDIYANENPNLPSRLMSGVCVYPPDAFERLKILQVCPRAWDVEMAHIAVPKGAQAKTIQHFWGEPGLPPTFAEGRPPNCPRNLLTLESIRPGVVLWHRNKDGSLESLLRQKLAIPKRSEAPAVMVVFPFCSRDWPIALRNLQWMAVLNSSLPQRWEIVLHCDSTITEDQLGQATSAAAKAFCRVSVNHYPAPKNRNWPMAPNVAFQQAALHMATRKQSWLWLEPDAIPVRPDWLQALQSRYDRCGKPFMGPIVKHMGHMNGVGIYPFDFPKYSPDAMRTSTVAWDFVMREDMIDCCHDASDLIQHCWGIVGGQPHHRDGPAATFHSQKQVDEWLNPSSVIFHRCKDGSIIDRLIERRK
jgi:hypothetical protein